MVYTVKGLVQNEAPSSLTTHIDNASDTMTANIKYLTEINALTELITEPQRLPEIYYQLGREVQDALRWRHNRNLDYEAKLRYKFE